MKSIIITGATSGIGYECALETARVAPNEQIIIACRNLPSGNKVIATIKKKTGHSNIICLPLDLNSLQSVREFKAHFAKTNTQISTLINNAGLQIVGKTQYTKDGFEETFGVNHLNPLYLTLLLLPHFTNDGCIVFTASGTHDPKQKTGMPAPAFKEPHELAFPKESNDALLSTGQVRYTTSKLCNVMTVYELQRRLSNTGIRVNAFDPGFVPGTGLARTYSPFLKFVSKYVLRVLILFHHNVNTAGKSGKRLAHLACSDKYKNVFGKYFEGAKEIKSSTDSYNVDYQNKLWHSSIELVGIKQEETIVPIG